MKNLNEFKSTQEIINTVKSGKDVFYENSFYKLKIDFEGDCVIKCTQNSSQELLSKNHDLNKFYTF